MKYIIPVLMFVIVAVAAVLILGGDTPGGPRSSIKPPSDTITKQIYPDRANVDVYIDASVSMAGYTAIAANNEYRELPDELYEMGSSMGEVKFFGFGENVYPVSNLDYRKYSDVSSYTELSNSIKNVIAQADTSHLTVIVTDLFETDTAWSAVSQGIKDKYFHNRLALAVIGVKNPFNGRIYDVGINQLAFDYNSNTDKTKYRPFYMLVMGPEIYVNDFITRWNKRDISNECKFVKLSSNLMEELKYFEDTEEIFMENINTNGKLELPENSKAVELEISDVEEPAKLVRRFVFEPDVLGCAMDMTKIKVVSELQAFNEEDGSWSILDSSKLSCSVIPVEGVDNAYDVTIEFNPKDVLKIGQVNFMMVDVIPEYDGYVLPDWIKAWNMSGSAVGDPSQFDGAKTVNFMRTMDSLKDSVLKTGRPSFVHMEMFFNMSNY